MVNRVVMGESVQEKKMHYPVMTERQLALRWKISLKTLRRLRTCSPTEPSESASEFRTCCWSGTCVFR
jgi:hypothetical protein